MREIDPDISDLFFNYDHDEYHALPEDASDEESAAAVRNSAVQFAASVERAFGHTLDPDALVTDFFSRI